MVGAGCFWGGLAMLPVARPFEFTPDELVYSNIDRGYGNSLGAFAIRFSQAVPLVYRVATSPSLFAAPHSWPKSVGFSSSLAVPPTPAEVGNVLIDGWFVGAVGRQNITREICLLTLWCSGVDSFTLHSALPHGRSLNATLQLAITQLESLNSFLLFSSNIDLRTVPFRSWGFKEQDAEEYSKLFTTPYTVPRRLSGPMFTPAAWIMIREGRMKARDEQRVTRLKVIE